MNMKLKEEEECWVEGENKDNMWLELKALFSAVAFIFIAIVMSYIVFWDAFLAFLLIAALFLVLLGDMMIGWKICKYHLKVQLDPAPMGKEPCELHTLGGTVDYILTTKKPHGKREFVYNGYEASVINKGDYPIRFLNGNTGFIAHENHDENINLRDAKYVEKIEEDTKTSNIKKVYYVAKEEDKNVKE